jgi:hypothetical protein
LRRAISVSKISISRDSSSGIFPANLSAHEAFETFIEPGLHRNRSDAKRRYAAHIKYDKFPATFALRCSKLDADDAAIAPTKNKTHRRLCRRGGLLALRSLNAYRAMTPHCGALLQLQQEHASISNLWFTGLKLSYSGILECQFEARGGGWAIRRRTRTRIAAARDITLRPIFLVQKETDRNFSRSHPYLC